MGAAGFTQDRAEVCGPSARSTVRMRPVRRSRSGVAMFHAASTTFFTPTRAASQAALPGDPYLREPGARERHARALAYAARRRRAAFTSRGQGGPDVAYWKAGVPAALARAASIRAEPQFARLP